MSTFYALGMVESGNNDYTVGIHHEVSRYQILPCVWKKYALPDERYQHPRDALSVAQRIMWARVIEFERCTGTAPTNFQLYVLWNAPRDVMHPSRIVAARATRFCNLLSLR